EGRCRRTATAEEGAGPGVPAGRGPPRGRGSAGGEGGAVVACGRAAGTGRQGAGVPRPRRPGAPGRPTRDHRNPLTWANTDSEGREGRPAHLDVAPVTWGRASWGRIGPPGPLMAAIGAVIGDPSRPEGGNEGAGNREGAAEGAGTPHAPSTEPVSSP